MVTITYGGMKFNYTDTSKGFRIHGIDPSGVYEVKNGRYNTETWAPISQGIFKQARIEFGG